MTSISIPVTTFRISSTKPNQKWGSPGALPLQTGVHRILAHIPLDKVPVDGVMQSAKLQFYFDRARAGDTNVRVQNLTSAFNSSVTWAKQPTVGSVLATTTPTGPVTGQLVEFDLLAWARTRDRNGLRIETTSGSPVTWLRGSSASTLKPVLVVDYIVKPDTPSNLTPSGGSVSGDATGRPILTYVADEDMTAQKIEWSTAGTDATITAATAWLPAVEGRYEYALDPGGAQPALTDGGTGIYWRATTDGPTGQSDPSPWAYYEYDAIAAPVITNPPATTDDGSPTLQWTVTDQVSWRALFSGDGKQIEDSGWRNEPATRDWTPNKSVKVPGHLGRFVLYIRDSVTPRVAAENADTRGVASIDFTTVSTGAGNAATNMSVWFDDPTPVIEGTRPGGIPDYVRLFRDGLSVTLWDPIDGTPYAGWAPAVNFFSGSDFTLPDYTSDPRHEHTWQVQTKVGDTASEKSSVTDQLPTEGVWILDPRTGDRVQVYGYNALPVVDQATTEAAVLHTPVHGELIVEPVRRRLMRTTRSGTITGAVVNEDEATLLGWVEGDSGLRYRLIFGKVNWPIIFGDYSPADNFYPDVCGPDRVLVSLNWWQRLADV